jgi:serine/threonine-protein kinase
MAAAEELDRPDPLPLAGAVPAGFATADDPHPTLLPPPPRVAGPTDEPGAESTGLAPSDTGAATAATAATADDTDADAADYVDGDAGTEGRRRRRRWPAVLVGVLVLAALAVAGVLAWRTLVVPSHEVPELVAMNRAAAEALIDENGWEIAVDETRRDGTTRGQVLEQDPPAGESLQEGETVRLTVSLGPLLRTVPTDLAELPFEEARARLEAAGLAAADPVVRFHETVEEGHVIRAVDATPAEAETGTPITLVVSQGPRPRVVPPSAGQTLEQVCADLAAVQLECERGEAFSDTVPAGQVIGTDPGAGEEVSRGSTVRVLVSQGPRLIPVPEVRGMDVLEASQTLEDAGFTVTGVRGSPFRQVRGTDPAAGTRVERGTGIVLVTG